MTESNRLYHSPNNKKSPQKSGMRHEGSSPGWLGHTSNRNVPEDDNDELLRIRLGKLGFDVPRGCFANPTSDDMIELLTAFCCDIGEIDESSFHIQEHQNFTSQCMSDDVLLGTPRTWVVYKLLKVTNFIIHKLGAEPVSLLQVSDPHRYDFKQVAMIWAFYADMRDCRNELLKQVQHGMNEKLQQEENAMAELVKLLSVTNDLESKLCNYEQMEKEIYTDIYSTGNDIKNIESSINEFKTKIDAGETEQTLNEAEILKNNLEIRELEQQLLDSEKVTLEDCISEDRALSHDIAALTSEISKLKLDVESHTRMNEIYEKTIENGISLYNEYDGLIQEIKKFDDLQQLVAESKKEVSVMENDKKDLSNKTKYKQEEWIEMGKQMEDIFSKNDEIGPHKIKTRTMEEKYLQVKENIQHTEDKLDKVNEKLDEIGVLEVKLSTLVQQCVKSMDEQTQKLMVVRSEVEQYHNNGVPIRNLRADDEIYLRLERDKLGILDLVNNVVMDTGMKQIKDIIAELEQR